MNIKRMHIGVNLEVQKIASNLNDDLLPQEIDYYLNEAIEDFIDQQYTALKTEQRDLESQYVNDNLRSLLSTGELDELSPVDYISGAQKAELPNDYRYYVFSRTYNGQNWISNRILSPKGLKAYSSSKTNLPIFREYPVYIENNMITVIPDSESPLGTGSKLVIKYIKNPAVVKLPDTDCDLPDHTHRSIVQIAASKIIRSLNVGQEQ